MTARTSEPLPECTGCARPTKRATYRRTGGYCSVCASMRPPWVAKVAAAMDTDPAALEDAAEWQRLAHQRHLAAQDELAARRARREARRAR